MGWIDEIANLRREMRMRVEQIPAMLFGWTLTAKSSEMGDFDAAEKADGDGTQRPVRRIEPWGHRGRPPGKVRSFWVRLGSSNVLFLGVAPSKGYGPTDLNDGETALYSAEVQRGVYLNNNGDVVLTAKGGASATLNHDGSITLSAAAGKTVNVNGSTFSLPKTETLLADLATWCTNIIAVLQAGTAGTPAAQQLTGLPAVLASLNTFVANLSGSAYKSINSKNG